MSADKLPGQGRRDRGRPARDARHDAKRHISNDVMKCLLINKQTKTGRWGRFLWQILEQQIDLCENSQQADGFVGRDWGVGEVFYVMGNS